MLYGISVEFQLKVQSQGKLDDQTLAEIYSYKNVSIAGIIKIVWNGFIQTFLTKIKEKRLFEIQHGIKKVIYYDFKTLANAKTGKQPSIWSDRKIVLLVIIILFTE